MSSPTTLKPRSLVISEVAAFWKEVMEANARGPVTIDLDGLERLDGAGAQLLAVAATQGAASGISLQRPSSAAVGVARLLGLEILSGQT